jgi:hypothetical protein
VAAVLKPGHIPLRVKISSGNSGRCLASRNFFPYWLEDAVAESLAALDNRGVMCRPLAVAGVLSSRGIITVSFADFEYCTVFLLDAP